MLSPGLAAARALLSVTASVTVTVAGGQLTRAVESGPPVPDGVVGSPVGGASGPVVSGGVGTPDLPGPCAVGREPDVPPLPSPPPSPFPPETTRTRVISETRRAPPPSHTPGPPGSRNRPAAGSASGSGDGGGGWGGLGGGGGTDMDGD